MSKAHGLKYQGIFTPNIGALRASALKGCAGVVWI
ncbi:Uncharacterised protein [Vibrio cholerae]|nr:Uncharacterised protein [Vibrio cholerae]